MLKLYIKISLATFPILHLSFPFLICFLFLIINTLIYHFYKTLLIIHSILESAFEITSAQKMLNKCLIYAVRSGAKDLLNGVIKLIQNNSKIANKNSWTNIILIFIVNRWAFYNSSPVNSIYCIIVSENTFVFFSHDYSFNEEYSKVLVTYIAYPSQLFCVYFITKHHLRIISFIHVHNAFHFCFSWT